MARVLAQNGLRLWSYNLLQVASGPPSIYLTVKKFASKTDTIPWGEISHHGAQLEIAAMPHHGPEQPKM